jgi:hypothetical protein
MKTTTQTDENESGADDARPFAWTPAGDDALLDDLVNWQRAALRGEPFTPVHVPAKIAVPLYGRLRDARGDVRCAFDPAFAAAKAGFPAIDLDNWWVEYAETEAEAADRLEALWDKLLVDIAAAVQKLPAGASAEAVNTAIDRVLEPYAAAHYAAIEPLAIELYRAGAALGSDQVDAKMAAKAVTQPSLGILWNLVNQNAVAWARQHAGFRVTRVTDYTRQEVRRLVTERMSGGLTHEELVEELMAVRRGEDGGDWDPVFGRKRAELIAQTEATYALDGGQEAGWRTRGVRKATWYTANDERVCVICGALYRKVAGLGDAFAFTAEELARMSPSQKRMAQRGITGPPAHPGCRCTREPGADEDWED